MEFALSTFGRDPTRQELADQVAVLADLLRFTKAELRNLLDEREDFLKEITRLTAPALVCPLCSKAQAPKVQIN